jgi:hypothetical protein
VLLDQSHSEIRSQCTQLGENMVSSHGVFCAGRLKTVVDLVSSRFDTIYA